MGDTKLKKCHTVSDFCNLRYLTSEEKDKLIIKLRNDLEIVSNDLIATRQERDNLLCEVNKLKFEIQITDLKFLRGEKFNSSRESHESNCYVSGDAYYKSATSKVDRPYCGPGPPDKLRASAKANGIEGHNLKGPHYGVSVNGTHHHMVRRPQAVSQSAMMGGPRHAMVSLAVADDCSVARPDRWRRNVSQNVGQSYELSQDLADKRLEMLERRYGGDKARRAATVIQRAYRHYKMRRKFIAITEGAKAQEKRLSRRLTLESIGVPSSEEDPRTLEAQQRVGQPAVQGDKSNVANRPASGYGTDHRRPSRSLSMRDPPRGCPMSRSHDGDPCEGSAFYPVGPTYLQSSCHAPNGAMNGDHTHPQGPLPHSHIDIRLNHCLNNDFISQESSGKAVPGGVRSKPSSSSSTSKLSGLSAAAPKKPVPDLPKRSSSMKSESGGSVESFSSYSSANCRIPCVPPSLTPPSSHSSEGGSDRGVLRRSANNGSLSSVQSSGSDSSLSQPASERGGGTPLSHQSHDLAEFPVPASPVWKRKSQMSEVVRKRQYRVGLNLFNKKPDKGIGYLIGRSFLENSPQAVAKFLLSRKGLSKQMIGEFLGNLQNPFNASVLECFSNEIDLSGMHVDVGLRKFQAHFRMPGEAQKIERLMQVFAQRYCQCNGDFLATLRDPDTVFVLAFAIIMLNTDLHTASLKPEKRMKLDEFVKNLRGVDDGCDIDRAVLEGMYQRIKTQEFRPAHDHVTQVLKVQQTIVGKKPVLAVPHRRLVCYCRLYEVPDPTKKERTGLHQREVFLFNDLLVVTKIFSKKKNSISYTFRTSFPLAGLSVLTKEATHHPFLLEVKQRVDGKQLALFNARNEHDRTKFCEDLRESILEMDEMENLRIEGELERQKANVRASRPTSTSENRDSGVADMELITITENCALKPETTLKRTTLSNSLLDIHEAGNGVI